MLAQVGKIQTIQVGIPHKYVYKSSEAARSIGWQTSFFRTPSPESRWLYSTHLEGNEQADKKNHGQPGQIVLMYAASHYPLWQAELNRPEIGPGGFGENFTVEGFSEKSVAVGDRFRLGEAVVEVSGPRYPCTKIERRWNQPGLTAAVARTGRTGWYCRVIKEGQVRPGMPLELVESPYPDFTMALINDFGHERESDPKLAQALAECPLLPVFWQELVARWIK